MRLVNLLAPLILVVSCSSPKSSEHLPSQGNKSVSEPKKERHPDTREIKILFQPPAPLYPPEAKAAGIQGTVVVEVLVGIDGVPISAKALEGPVELWPTAESYALQWKFSISYYDGEPQKARFKMNLPFKLK